MRKILTIFETKFYSFWEKMWRFLQENLTIISGKSSNFSRKIYRFFQGTRDDFCNESLIVFTGTFDDFSGKFDDFFSKICWFLFLVCPRVFYQNNSHPSKTRQILLQKSSNFLIKISKFSWRIVKFFCNYLSSNFSVKIINFPHKNCQNFLAIIFKFSCKACQIFV